MGILNSQTLATLGTARIDHSAATTGFHANQKAMGAGASGLGGLIGALHGGSSLLLKGIYQGNPSLSQKTMPSVPWSPKAA
jgi:hypothetical protein